MMYEQGSEWVAFIAKELDREYGRRDRLNTRSATTITSATTLVTVSLAVVAVLKGQHLAVSGVLRVGSLLSALVLLLAAAVLSILAGVTRSRLEVAAVVGLPDEELGQRIVAFVVGSSELEGDELIDYVARELSVHKRPREVRVVDALPRNAMGKVLKKQLLSEG
ncbi:hypothetical protein MHEI_32160 [Mycobacterium heidelbergense]|nr:hypothetical protein MHEI_32160 [Mycobacterium heidelbergense]